MSWRLGARERTFLGDGEKGWFGGICTVFVSVRRTETQDRSVLNIALGPLEFNWKKVRGACKSLLRYSTVRTTQNFKIVALAVRMYARLKIVPARAARPGRAGAPGLLIETLREPASQPVTYYYPSIALLPRAHQV